MKGIKKRVAALAMALCMALGVLPVWAGASESTSKTVSGGAELIAAFADSSVTVITLEGDIDMSGENWKPVVISKGRTLVIDGQDHKIMNMRADECLQPAANTEVGSGSSCDYYCGFVGKNEGSLTINNLTFTNAEVDIKAPSEYSTGSSILSVVCANNTGTLEYNNVTVDGCVLRGYTKAGLLQGYGNGRLNPRGEATRAQVAKMLMQFCLKYWEQ